jgi:hypothetical protein
MQIAGHLNPTGQVGVPYSSSFSASGGTAPYVYGMKAGTLPMGITIKAQTGEVSGTPVLAGTKTGIHVKATDALGVEADSIAMSISISPAA